MASKAWRVRQDLGDHHGDGAEQGDAGAVQGQPGDAADRHPGVGDQEDDQGDLFHWLILLTALILSCITGMTTCQEFRFRRGDPLDRPVSGFQSCLKGRATCRVTPTVCLASQIASTHSSSFDMLIAWIAFLTGPAIHGTLAPCKNGRCAWVNSCSASAASLPCPSSC